MSILSDLMVVVIVLVGFGLMTSGKPKRNTHIIKDSSGDMYYYRKDNFTKKIIKVLAIIIGLYLLGTMLK